MNLNSTMKQVLLHDGWTLQDLSDPALCCPAVVPGCVHTDLLRAGKIPDPWFRDQEKEIRWVERRDWVYRLRFQVEPELLNHRFVELVFEGLDTLCTVEVNGTAVLEADNMHRTWWVDVKDLLTESENRLRLTFRSPLPLMKERDADLRLFQWNVFHQDHYGKSYVRKMACAFGWDWGLMAPTAGIWRACRLVARDAKLEHVQVRQIHENGRVRLQIKPRVKGEGHLTTVLSYKGEAVARSGEGEDLMVSDPQLWWPNGMGAQPLYDLRTELRNDDGRLLDEHTVRIGLRELHLLQEPDEHGTCFRFQVNGNALFAKGANWIPCDVFPSRVSDHTYRHLLQSCARAHMNMLRVWGGGIYEDERFYDLCDELGILVWQDFMFACSAYPANDPRFMASVRAEARDNVRRLHHRACLALWCGNNELEQGLVEFGRTDWVPGKPMPGPDYLALFDHLLPEVVAEEDGVTSYWPSSGHTPGKGRRNPSDDTIGDAHSWSVWFGGQPIEAQRNWNFRFMSEFGFQSFPEPRTVESFCLPEERNLVNWVMDFHQRSAPGNQTILKYLLEWFPLPGSFDAWLWMTQMVQALCIQVAADHARRIQGRMDGLLFWQVNDLWPGATWSSIDVYGRWKALQYFVRRAFAPVVVSAVEQHRDSTMTLHVSNHRPQAFEGVLRWRATTCSGKTLLAGEQQISVPSQSNREIITLDCTGLRRQGGEDQLPLELQTATTIPIAGDRDLLFWAFVEEEQKEIAHTLGFFAKPKYWQLKEPGIELQVIHGEIGPEIVLTTTACAPWTRLELDGEDVVFSDNFLHLIPGRETRVSILNTQSLSVNTLKKKLRITPLLANWN